MPAIIIIVQPYYNTLSSYNQSIHFALSVFSTGSTILRDYYLQLAREREREREAGQPAGEARGARWKIRTRLYTAHVQSLHGYNNNNKKNK